MKEFIRFTKESWSYMGWKMFRPYFWSAWTRYSTRLQQAKDEITVNRNITRKQYVADRLKSRKLNKELNNGTTN